MSFLGGGTLSQFADPGDIMQQQPNSKFQKPTMPKPPNLKGLIDEQARVNRINQYTPFGNLTFTTNGNGQTVAHYNLSPQYQKLSDQLFGNISQASNFNPANLQTGFNQRIANRYYNNAMQLLQPQMQQQQEAFTQNLADRGLPAGSQLAGSLTDQFNSGQNNLRLQTAQDAISQGLAYTQAQNQARQQQQQANQSYLQGMQGLYGAFTPGLNQFFSPSGVDVNGSASIAQNAINNAYQQQMNAYSANQQGLFGLGAAGLAAMFGG